MYNEHPGFADPDIPYLCGACREAGFGDEDLFVPRTVEICFGDLTPEAQKRLLDGFGICGPEEMNWNVFPVFVLYPGIEDFSSFEEF